MKPLEMSNSDYNLQYIDPKILKKNVFNSNVVSPENEAKIDESLKRMGLFKPIIVRELSDSSLEIIGGEHRCDSAVRLGMKKIPVFNLGKIDDKRAKEISLADNARYGVDDNLALAKILEDIGIDQNISNFLPFEETDISAIFASTDLNLDDLELPEDDETAPAKKEADLPKEPKTHTIMRFKIALGDAEKLTALIAKTQKHHNYTSSDELTNAGDALIHLVFGDKDE